MTHLEEGIRLKSFGEFKDGIRAAGERLNRHVLQPASKFIKNRLPKSDVPPSTQQSKDTPTKTTASSRRATGGLDGVGTAADNKGAVKLKVQNDPGLDAINRQAQQSTKRNYPDWWAKKGPSGTAWYGQQQFQRDLTK